MGAAFLLEHLVQEPAAGRNQLHPAQAASEIDVVHFPAMNFAAITQQDIFKWLYHVLPFSSVLILEVLILIY